MSHRVESFIWMLVKASWLREFWLMVKTLTYWQIMHEYKCKLLHQHEQYGCVEKFSVFTAAIVTTTLLVSFVLHWGHTTQVYLWEYTYSVSGKMMSQLSVPFKDSLSGEMTSLSQALLEHYHQQYACMWWGLHVSLPPTIKTPSFFWSCGGPIALGRKVSTTILELWVVVWFY